MGTRVVRRCTHTPGLERVEGPGPQGLTGTTWRVMITPPAPGQWPWSRSSEVLDSLVAVPQLAAVGAWHGCMAQGGGGTDVVGWHSGTVPHCGSGPAAWVVYARAAAKTVMMMTDFDDSQVMTRESLSQSLHFTIPQSGKTVPPLSVSPLELEARSS